MSECYGSCSKLATEDHEGRNKHCEGQRYPKNTNEGENRAIVRVATSAPKLPPALIWPHLQPSRHLVISRETIRMKLADAGIRSWCPLRSLLLTMHHKQCWMDFCRSRQAEALPTGHMIFRDESRFYFSADDHCTSLGRHPGQWSDSVFFFLEWHTVLHEVL